VISIVTRWRALQAALQDHGSGTWIRTRRRGLTVRSFTVNGCQNEKCRALPSNTGQGARLAFVARAGFEPAISAL
jgi:hypothetical protein